MAKVAVGALLASACGEGAANTSVIAPVETALAPLPAGIDDDVPRKKPNVTVAAPDKNCCKGQNDCKGKGMCKTDDNDCAGKNECKAKGGCKPPGC